jgi:DNA-binding winged helix-turn-helix (wHTH) protein/tetratricopeptide (TPR) repeat protein
LGEAAVIYVFHNCELDDNRYELHRNGAAIKIEPKVFNVLAYLIEHRNRVVTKDELKATLWPSKFTTDDALGRCVMEARKAVQDNGAQQQVIKTLRGRGYQFVAPLVERADAAANDDVLRESQSPNAEVETLLGHRHGDVLVGRQREIKALQVGLADAVAGRGRLVLLVGEPGIGKTRLAEEFATYAYQHNVRVLIGRCYEGEGAPAFWPWIQIVRSYVRTREPAALQAVMGSGAADIAAVVPAVQQQLPDVSPTPALESKQAQFRFFDSFTTFFKTVATEQPLLLMLDDLHWSHPSSLLLLQFLARELQDARILVVGTYSALALGQRHPLMHTLGGLVRTGMSQHLTLRGLSEQDVAQFMESTTGQQPPEALVTLVHRKSEGNPFFVKEIVRLLDSEGHLWGSTVGASGDLTLPQEVHEVIGRRLAFLSPPCARVLSMAAVIGREFDLDVLEPLSDLSGDLLLTVLEEAVTTHLVEEVPGTVGRYRFTHTLIHETLYDRLMTVRRVQVHGQIGTMLEALHKAKPESHLDEIAYHFCEAAASGADDIVLKAIDYAVRAGKQDTTMLAYEDAVEHYERALRVLERRQPVDEGQRGELLLALGAAQMRAGDTLQAWTTLQHAADLGKRLESPELLARAALSLSSDIAAGGVVSGFVDAPRADLLEEALYAIGEADSTLRAGVMSRLAVTLYYTADAARAVTLSQQAIDMAARLDDTAAQLEALNSRHWTLFGPEHLEDQLAVATAMVRLAETAGDREMALLGHRWRLIDLLALGDMAAVEAESATYARLTDELRLPYYRASTTLFMAMRALLAGRFEEGEGLMRQALAVGQQAQPEHATQAFRLQMFYLRAQQGRLQELEDDVKGYAAQSPGLPGWRCALALLYSELDRKAEARSVFADLAMHDFTDLPRNGYWLIGMAYLAQICAYLGDARRAAMLYALLHPYAGRNALVGSVACYGSVSHCLGLLAVTQRRWEHAIEHFEAALAMHLRLEAFPLVASTQHAYAAMLLARGQRGDRQKALTLLAPVLETARDLGMRRLVEKAEALQHQVWGMHADVRKSSRRRKT